MAKKKVRNVPQAPSNGSRKPARAKRASLVDALSKLGRVLHQSKEIKVSVQEAATDLASVNEALKHDEKPERPVRTIEAALVQNEKAEQKVAKAAGDLNQVNTEIATEVAERIVIESELADTKTDLAKAHDDLSKSRDNEEEMRQVSLRDTLTGLANRVLLEEHLAHGLIQAKRRGWGLAVLFIDIDEFKSVNDSYGHDAGDKVLVMVADRLRASVRGEDLVSRWGGDEFVCLLLDVKHEADGARIAEKMVSRISEAHDCKGTVLTIRASIGVAMCPGDGKTADVLLKNADRAMYKAKDTGNGVMLFRDAALN